ncbi:MAG TPA: hypothetical protein VJP86_18055 [Vicinamibacterales bacterium]|jgi:hypothetical protein|nr:hypothetical protein [Vicinamibacterales bacterium]
MRHLTSEQLLDFAEGSLSAAADRHLAACEQCRVALASLRQTLSIASVEIPEPSPLFWEHLSARVKDAVERDREHGRAWFSWRVMVPALACTLAVVAAGVFALRTPAVTSVPSNVAISDASADSAAGPATASEDPAWALMGDLASGLDWDAAVEAGLGASSDAVDRAIYELTPDERQELQRLLKEELAQSEKGTAS